MMITTDIPSTTDLPDTTRQSPGQEYSRLRCRGDCASTQTAAMVPLARRLLSTVRGHVQAHSKAHATSVSGLQRAGDERPCCMAGYHFCMTSLGVTRARCRRRWCNACSALLEDMSKHTAKRTRRRRAACSVRQTSGRVVYRVVETFVCRVCRRRLRALPLLLARQLLSTVRVHVQAHSKAHATAAGGLQRAADERPCCMAGYHFCMTSLDVTRARCRCRWCECCSALLVYMSKHTAKRTRRRRAACSVRQTSGRVVYRVIMTFV